MYSCHERCRPTLEIKPNAPALGPVVVRVPVRVPAGAMSFEEQHKGPTDPQRVGEKL